MTITTLDGYIAANKQFLTYLRTGARTTVAAAWYTPFDLAGSPGAGVLAGTSTTTGVVPTDATTGCPTISFSSGTGYLSNVDFGSSVACRVRVYDLLWKAGAYAFNVNTSGNTPTSFLGRIPGGTAADTAGQTELWVEQVTTGTGTQSVNVTYTNSAGTTGRSTGTVAAPVSAAPVGRMWPLPLQAGDVGVSGVTGVVGSVATVGTFNILVMRKLWEGRVRLVNDGDVHALDKTGMPIVFLDSALYPIIATDSTAIGVPELNFEIVNG
jgi:hypothetical protein